ncbi:MAG: N-acetylmuramoyl-L-alanine amidase [Verrucomicrobiota bacterium]
MLGLVLAVSVICVEVKAEVFRLVAPHLEIPKSPDPPKPPVPKPFLSRMGEAPNWAELDAFQYRITRQDFEYLLGHCYVMESSEAERWISLHDRYVEIVTQSNYAESVPYRLHFAAGPCYPKTEVKYWRSVLAQPPFDPNDENPLVGAKIAVDPGHIGGKWVTWDDRDFKIGTETMRVREGEMTLKVAKILQRDLTALGAQVFLTRESNEPVTSHRPEDLKDEARAYLIQRKKIPSSGMIADTAKKMFAISGDIQARADLLNHSFQPDLVLCLHFNAIPWGRSPSFRTGNHLHLLCNGAYTATEVREDDSRFEMIMRIVQRIYYEEAALADALSRSMAKETRLPAFGGYRSGAKKISQNPYIWARNLVANRTYMCPVIFFEPYCMNDRRVFARIQAGEYRGLREFEGIYKKNIYQEYADGITSGLMKYFRTYRPRYSSDLPD